MSRLAHVLGWALWHAFPAPFRYEPTPARVEVFSSCARIPGRSGAGSCPFPASSFVDEEAV